MDATPWPTLGLDVGRWIERHLVHGPGDVRGRPVSLTDEEWLFLFRAYEVFPHGHDLEGRRRFKRCVYSRRKGVRKTELLAWVAIAEMDPTAPVRCRGWREEGGVWVPVGGHVVDPYIPLIATTEEQSGDLAYGAVKAILENCELGNQYLIGEERILHRDEPGELKAMAGAPSARDGARTSFQGFDECLALDTPVPTPSGWSTIGEIEVGDTVLGSDGAPAVVLGVSSVHERRRCYRVHFSDGTAVTTDAGHLWSVFDRRRPQDGFHLKTTEAIAQEVTIATWRGADMARWATPIAQPLKLPEAQLPIDPYVLGVWLGDGDSSNATIFDGAADLEEIMGSVTATGYPVTQLRATSRTPGIYVRGLKSELRSAGLLGAKRIPPVYLRGSRLQRLELLRGLMDTDGHATTKGWATFVTGREDLADQVAELARTLAYRPTIISTDEPRSRTGVMVKVSFQADPTSVPFRLARKAARCCAGAKSTRLTRRSIVAVEPVESVPVRCLSVDTEDHLFLVGPGMVPTHNTHLYVSDRLRKAHAMMLQNVPKRREADPWSGEFSTMYAPAEESVAEASHLFALEILAGRVEDPRLLFDHRQASEAHDLDTRKGLMAAIVEASGDAVDWADVDAIAGQYLEAAAKRDDVAKNRFRRFWLNQRRSLAGRAFPIDLWTARAVKKPRVVEAGTEIVLALDGSYSRDSTALVGCTVEEKPHVFVLGAWERPPGQPRWRTPRNEVLERVEEIMAEFIVVELAPDPPGWHREVEDLEATYGAVVVRFETNQPARMGPACDEFDQALRDGAFTQDGDPGMWRHVSHCVQVKRGRHMLVTKEHPDSPLRIDLAIGAIIAFTRASWHWRNRSDMFEPMVAFG